jgi:hypothetical protein
MASKQLLRSGLRSPPPPEPAEGRSERHERAQCVGGRAGADVRTPRTYLLSIRLVGGRRSGALFSCPSEVKPR